MRMSLVGQRGTGYVGLWVVTALDRGMGYWWMRVGVCVCVCVNVSRYRGAPDVQLKRGNKKKMEPTKRREGRGSEGNNRMREAT